VSNLRRLQVTDDALALAMWIVDDDLDRVDALDRATGGRAVPTHELGQLAAEIVVERLVKAHPHHAALARSQTKPTVNSDGDMHAPANQPSRAIRTTQAAVLLGSLLGHRERVGHTIEGDTS
jgi:hypothetical protein